LRTGHTAVPRAQTVENRRVTSQNTGPVAREDRFRKPTPPTGVSAAGGSPWGGSGADQRRV